MCMFTKLHAVTFLYKCYNRICCISNTSTLIIYPSNSAERKPRLRKTASTCLQDLSRLPSSDCGQGRTGWTNTSTRNWRVCHPQCVPVERQSRTRTTSCRTEGTSGGWEGRCGQRTSCTARWCHCSRPLHSSLGLFSTCNDGKKKKKKLRENNLIAIRIWLSRWSFYPSLHKVSLTFSLMFLVCWFIIIYILCTCSTLMSHVDNVHMKFGVRIIDAQQFNSNFSFVS